jgi:hypothetical protein
VNVYKRLQKSIIEQRRKPNMMRHYTLAAAGVLLLLLMTGATLGDEVCRWERPDYIIKSSPPLPPSTVLPDVYTGTLRVYVTEIVSDRWHDSDGEPYENAFLAFAMERAVTLDVDDTLSWSVVWDGANYSSGHGETFDDIDPDNIKVFAVVFNSAYYAGYSYPPSGYYFQVHETDASAFARPGQTGYNLIVPGFTHSVFIEDGTATW